MPSRVTDVPGSHGPKQSGSVIVPIEVPTQTSIMFLESHLIRFIGGEFVIFPSSLFVLDVYDDDDADELGCDFDGKSVVFGWSFCLLT